MTLNNFIRGLKQFSLWHDHQIDLYLYATRSRRTWVRAPLDDTLLLTYGGFIIDDMRVADGRLACYINAVYPRSLNKDCRRTPEA